MLVILPPSETKSPGGDPSRQLDMDALSWTELARARERIARTLIRTSGTKRAADTLGLGPTQADELRHNLALLDAPTMPAIERYTGVLYDALDTATLAPADRTRAAARIAIGSALFGLVRADDQIPAYRLSGDTRLPRIGTLASVWKPVLAPLLADLARDELIVDLRSGTYRVLAPAPDAVTVRVLTERPDGTRSVVSHFNKATKGLLARLLVQAPDAAASIDDVAVIGEQGGLHVERRGPRELDVITR